MEASRKQKPMVAVTFDDGPDPVYSNAILDILERYNAAATFFDLGQLVECYPHIARRELALNCEVASHSYGHKDFLELTDEEIVRDIKTTSEIFQKAIGRGPSLFRPPYGNLSEEKKDLIPYPIILWSMDTHDWESQNVEAILAAVKKAGNLDGRVMLMHSIYEATAKAAEVLIPYLLEKGYQLVTVSQMIEWKYKETPQNSKIYDYGYFRKKSRLLSILRRHR